MKILIAEDDENSRVLLKTALSSEGHTVYSASDGAMAMSLIRDISPDLIISDILMPKIDGFELCRQVKNDEQLKNIPVVFYTATYIEPKDEQLAMSLGASRFIVKPMEIGPFIEIIDGVIEERKAGELPVPKQSALNGEQLEERHAERLTEKLAKKAAQLKREHDALDDSIRYNRLLFEESPIGLALCRVNGELVDVNPAYARIIGRTVEETLSLSCWDITPQKYAEAEKYQLENLYQFGRYGPYEKEYIHKDGHLIPVQLSGILLERGDESYILSSIEDITYRKSSEAQLQSYREHLEEQVAERTRELKAANRELESFSYSVSHDLRAPLRAICGFGEYLQEEYGERLDDTGKDYLQRLLKAGHRMNALIDDLLMLSQVLRREMQTKTVDLSDMARDIAMQLKEDDPGRVVTFNIQEGIKAQGDPSLLQIALENLFSNAWKYTRRERSAEIGFGVQESKWGKRRVFYVQDNGIGMDMQYAAKLFTPFQRLHAAHEFEGTGIGLATVSRIFRRHGGEIWVDGKPGEGATFYFTLEGGAGNIHERSAKPAREA